MTLLWMSCLPSMRICSLMVMKAILSLASVSSNGDNLAERSAEAGELADDQAVSEFESAHQVIKPSALGRRHGRGGGLNKLVDPEAVPAGIFEDGEALALHVLAAGRNSEIGDGFHGSVYGKRFLALYLTLSG